MARSRTTSPIPNTLPTPRGRAAARQAAPPPQDADTTVTTLPNGVRVLAIHLPQVDSVCVSVFVRSGSRHESRRENGLSHVVEHMAFKGTVKRSCQRINLDAERLGAEVNAHTDRDHTAFHMRGLAKHAEVLVGMLGDIVRHSTFPADELERERGVILHELAEVEDDPVATAFTLFDRSCFGRDAAAQPVIGTRANIERFSRDDLLAYVQRQYTGANTIVAVAGCINAASVVAAAEAAFGSMPAGAASVMSAPTYLGGFASRRQAGSSQVQVVLGFPIPGLQAAHEASVVAATLFGEGMSSPLMDSIRERSGLVYYAACSADVVDGYGQFIIEAATGSGQLDALFTETSRLLLEHTTRIRPVDMERARNQLAVRSLATQERPYRRLEEAAQDLFTLGRVRTLAERQARIEAITPRQVRQALADMLAAGPTVALAGKPGRQVDARVLERFRPS